MISIVILGTGNVAQNLFEALYQKDEVDVVAVAGRSVNSLAYFNNRTEVITDWTQLPKADLFIMAITDDSINLVSEKFEINGLLVHTSGAVSINALSKHKHIGVFYPLQTFTKNKLLEFKNIPICIEAKNDKDLSLLKTVAKIVSVNVEEINSAQRKALHVSAVFVNNFTNHLFRIGEQICEQNDMDFALLKPLIKETVEKLDVLSPKQAQTGPARRGDQNTLHVHLKLLKEDQHREIYKLLSNAIKASYGEKL
jgi:predicted short-subunit dehydrogenase-like oxidoreductase (DUF2520 family)